MAEPRLELGLSTDMTNMKRINFRALGAQDLTRRLFDNFVRTQPVTLCWRKIDGVWTIEEDPFIDDWTEAEYRVLVDCLQNTVKTGGFVLGAFIDDKLKGFVSVEPTLFGSRKQYMDLSSIHVSQDVRAQGIGRQLFDRAKAFAKARGAEKLYISAHSAVESQAFYRAMGCKEAQEYNQSHVDKEPFDCQLECLL